MRKKDELAIEALKIFTKTYEELAELEEKYEVCLPLINWNKIISEYLEQL
jgi:hypothetical protein